MSKKTSAKKSSLGNRNKRNRRIPVLAILRTHRRVQHNVFQRDWRHRKLRIKG